MRVTHFSCFYVFGRRVSTRPSSSDLLFHLLVSSSPLRFRLGSSSLPGTLPHPEDRPELCRGTKDRQRIHFFKTESFNCVFVR